MMKYLRQIYNLYFSDDRDFSLRMKELLGFVPANLTVYKSAFLHRSTQSKSNGYNYSNERLEYLGDAILSSIVAEYLYLKYPKGDEGFLTKMRSKVVKRKSLNSIAEKMSLDVLLQEYNSARISSSMLGNAFEALIGAIYLDKGYEGARKFIVERILLEYLDMEKLEKLDDNFKSTLLEWCQKNGKEVQFKTVSKYKHDKRDKFKMAVMVDGVEIATSDAYNKKSAEQRASRIALKSMDIKQDA